MRRKENEPLEKITLNLYRGDMVKLRELHPQLGANKVVRALVRAHIEKVMAEAAKAAEPIPLSPKTQEVLG